ncbi:hypothetical protein H4Q26_006397 [Puccinia striiformis f. sp. tritici PST-130]|nr:hypothetical protein H4Q26_006397 [Puccinia striiformis f. sp. tritici PST-130]
MELHCPARVQTGTIAEGKPPSYVLARAGEAYRARQMKQGLNFCTDADASRCKNMMQDFVGPIFNPSQPSHWPTHLHRSLISSTQTPHQHLRRSKHPNDAHIHFVKLSAGSPGPGPSRYPSRPASAPAPLSPRKFPCPLRLYGECAYAVKKPKSGTKHPLVGEQVTLLDATEDEHNPGTWACPAKDIGIAEPSCCESQKNGFHMAREIWLKECPPNQTK